MEEKNLHLRVKYLQPNMEPLCYVAGKSDWIDLRIAQTVSMKAGEFRLLPLGVAIALPRGYEAHIVPPPSKISELYKPIIWVS